MSSIISCDHCGRLWDSDRHPDCPACLEAKATVAAPEADQPSTISRDEKAALRAVQQLYRTLPKGSHPGQMGVIKITRSWQQGINGATGEPTGMKIPITMASCSIRLYHSTSVEMDAE